MTATENEPLPTSGDPQGAVPPQGSVPPTWRDQVARARALAKEHPAAVLAVAAGTGLLVAAEFTVGALAGVGAAVFIGRKIGPEKREQLLRRSEELLEQARAQGERAFYKGKAEAEQLFRHGPNIWPFRTSGKSGNGGGNGAEPPKA
jgi:hypothetical protein